MNTDDKGREYDERPWGNYTVLDDGEADHKIKRIVVNPHSRLSYQRHAHRAEHWFVVSGAGVATIEGTEFTVLAGDAITIAQGSWHRMENRGEIPLVFVEVQFGTYFGEDDIERAEDDYGRADN